MHRTRAGSPSETGDYKSFKRKMRNECLKGEISYSLNEVRILIQ